MLFVWIMAQPIRCFNPLDVIVGKQLRGIKGGPSECERLLQDGFDPNQLGPDGVSSMHLGAGLGIKPVCLLLQHGGNPNIRSSDGTTPVQVASMWGEPDCLQILLASGGDPFLEDQDGLNALDLAKKYKHPEIVQVLKQYMTLLNTPTEETITPKYTYTRRSTGSSASVRSESPELSDRTLDISAYDTQKLHEYLREFTKRRRSSVYLRSVQDQMNNYFGDGQKTHLVDVTSPDHPYIEPRYSTVRPGYNLDNPVLDRSQGRPRENRRTLSPVEESLHLHLSVSEDELSTSCDSFVTCDGEDLDQLNKSFDDGSEDETKLLNTVIKDSKFLTNLSVDNENNSNAYQSNQGSTIRQPVRSRGDKYCRREQLFLPPETEDLISVRCDLCSRDVEDFVQSSNELICKSCDKLSKELDALFIDTKDNVKTVKPTLQNADYSERNSRYDKNSENKNKKTEKVNSKNLVSKERPESENKNTSNQNIDEMIFKLRQSSLHRNPKVNVHNIPFSAKTKDLKSDNVPVNRNNLPYSAKTKDWKNDSLISSDESFIGPREVLAKSRFHPSDLSTITIEDSDIDSIKDEGFIGLSDESSTSTVKLKEDSEYRKTDTVPMSKFHHSDMSTITEVTELDNTELTVMKDNAFVCETDGKRSFPRKISDKQDGHDRGLRPNIVAPENENYLIKDSSQDYVDLWDEVRAQSMRNKNMLDTGFIRRESLTSYASDATTVEYVYTDPENGIALIERHIPSLCGSVRSRRSIDSQFSLNSQHSCQRNSGASQGSRSSGESENTKIYDWREEALCEGFGVKNEVDNMKTPTKKSDLNKLDNKSIRTKLCKHGADPGPVTDTTRQTYLSRLSQLENDPDAKIITKKSPEYPSELRCALNGNLDLSKMAAEEEKMFAAFQNPKRDHRWREGTLKSSFNYILLDPRVTKNLPNRSCNMNDLDVFQCFISGIFYVGKGKRARPYSHLYEAIKHMQKPKDKVSSKVARILEIWSAGLGVVSLHCFQSVIPVEAYTREACMVDALALCRYVTDIMKMCMKKFDDEKIFFDKLTGLHKLTNMKRGDYYGISVTYSMKKRREVGVYLLTKALQIFLAEGERQISPLDIKTDCGC